MPIMAVPQFHRLRIREVRPETDDSVSVAFEVPQPLREAYRFVQGQFLTRREQVGGEELRRSYSVCVGGPDYDRTGELRVDAYSRGRLREHRQKDDGQHHPCGRTGRTTPRAHVRTLV